MLTNQQRNFLRKMGNSLEPVVWIGKGEITDNIMKQIDDVLEARELVKISLLSNSEATAREIHDEIVSRLGAEGVQVIGRKILIYRRSTKKPVIELPRG